VVLINERGAVVFNRYTIAFFIFSFFGWLWETIYCSLRIHRLANRGFLYGPVCPIYGFAALVGFFIYDQVKSGRMPKPEWWMIFILGFVVSMVLEYPTSWAMEKMFKARWWDYSKFPMNINGRTSVPTSMAFGVAAIIMMDYLIPWVDRLIGRIPESLLNALALIFVAAISVDTTLTVISLTDFKKYVAVIDEGFQNHVSDFVNRVFGNNKFNFQSVIQRIVVFTLPGRKNRIAKQIRERRFYELIKDFYESDVVLQMDNYMQHGTTTTLEHCENVAWISYLINEKLRLNADEKSLVEAAMLHDLYLYDWHEADPERKLHGLSHPEVACDNAVKHFGISEKEQEAIRSHMWPLTITKIPKSKEAFIICIADKYCALIEMIRLNKYFGLRH